jgi:hypothetical protein
MKLKTEKISSYVLYAIIALTAIIMALFFGVGYNMISDVDGSMNAPLCTNLLLFFMYFLVVVTVIVTVLSIVHSSRLGNRVKDDFGVPSRKITLFVCALLVVSLIVTFAFGSSTPVKTSEGIYRSVFWLKITDMFIYTTAVLLVVAIAGLFVSMRSLVRKEK